MARTAKTITSLVANGGINAVAAGVYTTIDAALVTAGLAVTAFGAADYDKVFIHVKNTATADKTVTIKAGTYFRAGLGDLAVTVAANTGEQIIGPLESARFEQTDETLNIDFASGFTGSIAVFKLP